MDVDDMWDDPSFANLYENLGQAGESPFDGARLFDMSTATVGADSPNFPIKADDGSHNPSHQNFQSRSLLSSRSAESSSQDESSSETSGRKRKNTSATSESPPGNMNSIKMESFVNMGNTTNMASLHSMHNLSLEQDFANQFGSAASSPGGQTMDAVDSTYSRQMHIKPEPPVGTVEPSNFFFNSSTASPVSVKAGQIQDASPGTMFNNPTPSSDGADMFNTNQTWNNAAQNPAWNNDYANAFASPGALAMTPSPVMNVPKPEPARAPTAKGDRIPLHVAPIPAKSRVETQINIRLTLDYLPPRVKMLHLPTHTIAKAKLLAKEVVQSEDTLELNTMLVCTSAMNQPHLREKALEQAAKQDNSQIQARNSKNSKKTSDEEREESDKPANGGEVRICTNCINRERKRAARKKLKKEEEQAHWEKYETERVIVFNTNEYKPWQEWQQSPAPKDSNVHAAGDYYRPPETAMQVVAPMRIACYCRHQNEKDGFQVIFTIKDSQGNVVAQDMSDSILITDDHKTHPLATVPGQVWYDGQFASQAPFSSHSMVDLHSHMPAMSMSKSTGNLQSLGYGGPSYHQPTNMHQMQNYPSQPTSGTMTPRNLSRPGSPNSAGQSGPSKKRKSSSAHRRIPSTLAMTKMESNQAIAQPTASSGAPFSPTSAGFLGNNDPSYITMPTSATRSHFNTGPPTPIDGTASFPFGTLNRTNSMDSAAYQAFYSAPSSAHQSRAPSPVLVGPNLAAFQRQQAHGGATALPNRPNPFAMSGSSMASAMNDSDRSAPIINKVTPAEGPPSGGIEVSIYGSGFTPGMEVMFGDQVATATTYWGEKALCCVLPPGQVGIVPVAIAPSPMRQYPSPPAAQTQVFNYTGSTPEMQMMEMALRFYSQKETGRSDQWQALAQGAAQAWMSQGPGTQSTGLQPGQGAAFGDGTQYGEADMRFG